MPASWVRPERKKCRMCGEVKSASSFWKRAHAKDGLQTDCKDCQNALRRLRRNELVDGVKRQSIENAQPNYVEARARYAQTEKGKKAIAKAGRNYRKNHPEKKRAHVLVRRQLGPLSGMCNRCDNEAAGRHHEDYTKPLDVEPLCGDCHREVHQHACMD